MATERKDGRWQAKVHIGKDSKGKRLVKTFYGPSEEEAEKKANDYFKKYVVGSFEAVTLKEYATKYLAARKLEISQATYDSYLLTLDKHVYPFLGLKLVPDIKIVDLKNLFLTLERSGVGEKTRLHVFIILSLVFKEAAIDEVILYNPMLNVRKPKYKRKEVKIIPIEEFWQIYEIADERMKVILYLAWCTGLRVGEVVGLQWGDIDFKKNVINVSRSISRTSQGVMAKAPKTSYGKRQIPIPQKLAETLKAYKGDSLFVFTNLYGQMQDPGTISKSFSKLCKKLGFPYHFHQLRHTHATMLGDAGVKPKAIQERIGHSSSAFTLDVYTHKTEKTQEGIADLSIFEKR